MGDGGSQALSPGQSFKLEGSCLRRCYAWRADSGFDVRRLGLSLMLILVLLLMIILPKYCAWLDTAAFLLASCARADPGGRCDYRRVHLTRGSICPQAVHEQ